MKLIDMLPKLKRGPQVVQLKDASVIAAFSGIKSGDLIVDAGTGGGWLAAYLAQTVAPKGKVITYEKRKEFYELAKKNFKTLEFKNIKQKFKDIYKGISEKNIDLVVLDLAEPWKVIKHAEKSLKEAGFFVAYCPQMTQVIELCKKLSKSKLRLAKVTEILQRDWIVDKKIARPEHRMLGHTGFLVFARRN